MSETPKIPSIPRSKIIDGERYLFIDVYKYKNDATNRAERLRNKGIRVRTVTIEIKGIRTLYVNYRHFKDKI